MSEDDIGDKVNIGQIVSGEVFSEEVIEVLEVTNCSLRDKIPLDDPKVSQVKLYKWAGACAIG